jgi:ubiquinone biosynthesis protein
MLQKTLLNIEGLGRELYPEIDVWAVAKPELEAILREKHSVEHAAKDLRERLPAWLAKAPDMPDLIHDYLQKASSGQLVTRIASEDLAAIRREHQHSHRKTILTLAAGAFVISGSFLTSMETGPWFLWGMSGPGLAMIAIGGLLFSRALKNQI